MNRGEFQISVNGVKERHDNKVTFIFEKITFSKHRRCFSVGQHHRYSAERWIGLVIQMYPLDILYPHELTSQNASLMCKFAVLTRLTMQNYERLIGILREMEIATALHTHDLC